jgi:ParB-like chromosome segregation protein Spo0J
MDTPASGLEVDLHRLELRYAQARLPESRALEQLCRSIERCGQLIPCVVVAQGEQLVLLDGYRRVAALRRLGRDTARVELWPVDLAQGLLALLGRTHGRAFAALEEALLLRELVQGHGLSQHEVARRCGRDVSWVSRRLQLLHALPETLLGSVCAGTVSTWAALRVLAPLARANAEHAQQLLAHLQCAPLSTRELVQWFCHYQGARRDTRERLVQHPRLFVQAALTGDPFAGLRQGPEARFATDCQRLLERISRLRRALPAVAARGLHTELARALEPLRRALAELHTDLCRSLDDDPHPDSHQRAHPPGPGPQPARDQPPAGALAQQRAAHPALARARPQECLPAAAGGGTAQAL